MEFQTIVTLKEKHFEAIVHALRLYIADDTCACGVHTDLPLFAGTQCPPNCEGCLWCIGRSALCRIGYRIEA